MADAPAAPPKGGGPLAVITRKVGPLPVWAYAAILVAGYFLYRRMHPATTSSPTGSTDATDATGASTYVPPFDAASGVGGGGIGSNPGTVNNYYYGDEGTGQASGGGTSSGTGGSTGSGATGAPSTGITYPTPTVHWPASGAGAGQSPGSFQVPVSSQIGVGGSRASGVAGLV